MRPSRAGGPSGHTLARTVGTLCTRPDLWWAALATAARLAAPGWWRHRPYAPVPDGRWWAFRMETAYGRPDAELDVADVIAFLEWCRSGGRRFRHPGPGGRGEQPDSRLGSSGRG